MKIDKKLILAGTGLLFAGTGMAQVQQKDSTLNRTVVVENQYNPEVMDAFKVNVLPKVEEPAVAKSHIDYAKSMRPLTSYGFEPMGVISRDVNQKGARRGYLRGAYGMLNHADVKAAYLWDISEADQLDVMGSFYGHSGDDVFDGNQRFFRSDFGVNYSHAFDKVKFSLGGNFASQVFNYRKLDSLDVVTTSTLPGTPSQSTNQHFTMGNGYIGLSSVEGKTPLDFAVTVGFDAFKRKYIVGNSIPDYAQKMIFARGTVSAAWDENKRVGVDFGVNHVMYNTDDIESHQVGTVGVGDMGYENNTLVQLNPYYAIQLENLSVRLGAHVDIQSKVGSGLKVAPDVSIAYNFADSYVLYAQALGGTRLNDFNSLNQVSPYWNSMQQIKTTYTIFDAQAGLKASPANGLGFKLYGGYRLTKDDVFVVPIAENVTPHIMLADLRQDKSKVFYAGAGIDYDYRNVFSLGLKGQYNNWKMGDKDNISYLWLKPEYTMNADVNFHIYNGFKGLINYQYEARKKVAGERLDAVNSLKLGVEKKFTDCMNVFVHANNVLNQEYITETGYPELGINILGGVSLNF